MLQEKTPELRRLISEAPTLAVFSAFLLVSVLSLGVSDTKAAESKLDVQVNISEKTIVDIQPKSFSWGEGTTTVNPGSVAGPEEELNKYGRITIENLGSVNITNAWFNTTTPNTRPFGTGNPTNYDSGNLIALDSNTSTSDRNQYVGRLEYGLDQPADKDIIYLDTPSGWDYGRFRNASNQYFWAVDDTGASLDTASFRIGINPQTETSTGSTSLDTECQYGDSNAAGSNTNCNEYQLRTTTDGSGNTWAVTEVEVGATDSVTSVGSDGGEIYCAAMDQDQVLLDDGTDPGVYFFKWNKGHPAVQAAGSGSDCGFATNYTIGGAGAEELVPGGWKVQNIRAKIPFGTVSAQLPPGELFVIANSG